MKSSGQFVRGFEPPEYLVDDILQGGFLYSLTGATGSGKTAVALEFVRCVATGVPICGHAVERGPVIYFAGENPDDVRQRWIAMAEQVAFNVDEIPVHFVAGVVNLAELKDRIAAEVALIGPVKLVVVDTSAAYFQGDDENSNTEMGAYARVLRSLCDLPGNPTVIANCHPTKSANSDNLLPRGGGAFIAEVDGNLTCVRRDGAVEVHWQGKFRGAPFDPLCFETRIVTAARLRTKKGKAITTVYASQLTAADVDQREDEGRDRRAALLQLLLTRDNPPSTREIANELGLVSASGAPQTSTAHRLLGECAKFGLLKKVNGRPILTPKGVAAATASLEQSTWRRPRSTAA